MSNEYKFYVVMCQVTMMLVWMWMHSFLRLCIHINNISHLLKINTHSLFCVKIRKDFYENQIDYRGGGSNCGGVVFRLCITQKRCDVLRLKKRHEKNGQLDEHDGRRDDDERLCSRIGYRY